jgi:branched-subunit amino acid transport protein AzlD
MSELWLTIIIGSLAVYSWKFIGFYIPTHFSKNVKVAKVAATLTVALLAALTAVRTFTAGRALVDSKPLALAVAALMFWRKMPFVLVVASAAFVAAAARHFSGWQ